MGATGAWLRGRPGTVDDLDQPFLKLPGSNRLRTVPDGLWLCFGGTESDVRLVPEPVGQALAFCAVDAFAAGRLPGGMAGEPRFAAP
jgi:hypothetical protein